MSSPDSSPPLPPPPPRDRPSHARNLSDFSVSSSSSSSPTKPSPFTSLTATRSTLRRSGGGSSPEQTFPPSSSTLGRSRTQAGSGGSSSASNSPTLRRRSSLATNVVSSPSPTLRSSNAGPPKSSSNSASGPASSRHRASSLLTRVSPSLANSTARYSAPSTTIASVGLRGMHSPTGLGGSGSGSGSGGGGDSSSRELGLGIGTFSKGMGQLPSPPATASDAMSTGSGLTGVRDGSQNGSVDLDRRSKRSSGGDQVSTPTSTRFQVPIIERSSPSVIGSSPQASKRYSLQSTSSNGTAVAMPISASSRSGPTSPIEPLKLSSPAAYTFPRPNPSPNPNTSESDAATLKQSSDDSRACRPSTGKGKERERERSGSGDGDDPEARRAKRNRRAAELKEKNQRILDGINSNSTPLASPPPSQYSSSNDGSSPRQRPQTIRRSSTVGTMRSLLEDSQQPPSSATSSTLGLRGRASVDEFGFVEGSGSGSNTRKRSSTLGKMGERERERERESDRETERARRVRTLGHSSGALGSLGDSVDEGRWDSPTARRGVRDTSDELPPERSHSSMSRFRASDGARAGQKAEWLDREYERERARPSTSAGDSRDRDREIARSLRKLSSREDIDSLARSRPDVGDRRKESQVSSTLRQRPSLPLEFVQSAATRSSRPAPRLRAEQPSPVDTAHAASPRATSPRVSSPAFRDRASSQTAFTSNRSSRAESRLSRNADDPRTSFSGDGEARQPNSTTGLPLSRPARPGSWGRTKKGSAGSGSSSGVLPYHIASDRDQSDAERSLSRQKSLARIRTLSITESPSDREPSDRDDVFQNGIRRQQRHSMTPPASATAVSGDRYTNIATQLEDRKTRLRKSDVGSEAWLAEYQELRQRSTRSRASGSSGDARSSREVPPPVPQTPIERDRTIRAINALLTGQGISASDLQDIPQTAPGKLENRTRQSASPTAFDLVRSPSGAGSIFSRSGAESSRSVRFTSATGGEHHKNLSQALESFQVHFMPTEGRDDLAPESVELVKRMTSMVAATTKLNTGLRALATATTEAQIEAELDESSRSSSTSAGFVQFEKNVASLLRSSNDQVRGLTESLIAFTRVEREREKLRRDGVEVNSSRPASRAASFRGGSIHASPPKRPATSSPFEGATVSMSAARTSTSSTKLRDPMMEEPDIPTRRTTQSFSLRSPRSPYAGYDSPTPAPGGAARRDASLSLRSPLSGGLDRPSTPSRSAIGLPLPNSSSGQSLSNGIRRSKSSSTSSATARPPTPSSSGNRHTAPRSPPSREVASAVLDSTVATAGFSPTHASLSRANGMRTYSELDRPALDALGIELSGRAERDRDRETWRHTMSSASSITFPRTTSDAEDEVARGALQTPTGAGRAARQRLSTGSVGLGNGVSAAIRSGLSLVRGRRLTNEAVPPAALAAPAPPLPDMPTYTSPSSGSGSPEERRAERRNEIEQILRRTKANRADRASMS